MLYLGISALYHDSAAAIVDDMGNIIAAVQEERFTRIKQDSRIPYHAIDFCLARANTSMKNVEKVIFYEDPFLSFDRVINMINNYGLQNSSFYKDLLKDYLGLRFRVGEFLKKRYGLLGKEDCLHFVKHHMSHAASAFFSSPYKEAAILTVDGVGEFATTTISYGSNNDINMIEELDFPYSVGLFYSAFSSFCGFKVNSGEYKFMGLSPYGVPRFYDILKDRVINIRADGSFDLNMEYFSFPYDHYMTTPKMEKLLGIKKRLPESNITRTECDIAASVQKILEELMLNLAKHAKEVTGLDRLVMAGGVALNCVANSKIHKSKLFNEIWIQPAAGDAGGALGCAMYFALKNHKELCRYNMKGALLGPEYSDYEIEALLQKKGRPYIRLNYCNLIEQVASLLADGKVVGWFQGRMEFGPRALGNRSILADPRNKDMQSKLNLKIKHRESFRPFAPAVLDSDYSRYFEGDSTGPYMLFTTQVRPELRTNFNVHTELELSEGNMLPVIQKSRSSLPAITHVDYSARVQVVTEADNKRFYDLICSFREKTGCGCLVNTSFNERGEPIVCTPEDAYQCFLRTDMDVLVLGNFVLLRNNQPLEEQSHAKRKKFDAD